MGDVASVEMDGLGRSPSFTLALGSLAPADFHMVWNEWPLHTALIWRQLQNLEIKFDHHRHIMAREKAKISAPSI